MKLQRVGGFASIGLGCILAIYVVCQLLGVFQSFDLRDAAKGLQYASASVTAEFISNLLGILGSIAVVLMILAVRDRMEKMAPNLMRIVVIGGSIGGALWLAAALTGIAGVPTILKAQDASAYVAAMALTDGLLGASEHALGWALLLICWVALKNRDLPKVLSYILGLKGVIMIVTLGIIQLQAAGGLLGIISYPWLGIALLRSKS
jgi:hypothetical protein